VLDVEMPLAENPHNEYGKNHQYWQYHDFRNGCVAQRQLAVEAVSQLREGVLKFLEHAPLDLDQISQLLRPFDDVLEEPEFCRTPCNYRMQDNTCWRKLRGMPCEFHQGYD